MFEYHGWAALYDSLDGDWGAADRLTREAYDAVADALDAVRSDFQVADIRVVNGSCHLWLAGLRNHRQQAAIEVFGQVAAAAPWSYGLLQVHDDEAEGDESNVWVTWVMKRGSVSAHSDRFLSPHIGEVEDKID